MRPVLLFSALLMFATIGSADAQKANIDPTAVAILNRMADNLGALNSCSFRLDAAHDEYDANLGGRVRCHYMHTVYMAGPDKMLVNTIGDRGRRGFWYDGKDAFTYFYAENNYGRMAAPATILEMIDSLHDRYEIDFPAADFIYPTFVDDLIGQSQRVAFRKTVRIGDQDCFHVVATGPGQDVELWIAVDGANLPVQYLFRNHGKDGETEYEGTFADFRMNPELPQNMFSFTPPPGAREVRMMARDGSSKKGGKN